MGRGVGRGQGRAGEAVVTGRVSRGGAGRLGRTGGGRTGGGRASGGFRH